MSEQLTLSMLGALQVTLDQQPVAGFETNKVRALLAYLAVESGQAHPRELLAGLLWPEFPERSALNNLRFSLANLRKVIGDREAQPPYLLVQEGTIQFNVASNHRLDVFAFTNSIETGDIERLKQAVSLYRGPFLDGFAIAESDTFEEWIRLRREQLQRLMLKALSSLTEHSAIFGEYDQAQVYARRTLELEPWQEEGHRQLMRALALSGNRSTALAQYESCRRLLADELGVEPTVETTALSQQIANGTLEAPPPVPAFLEPTTQVEPVEQPHFVAREVELKKLEEFLSNAAAGRGQVAFVTGEPGSGKTMLLQAFAHQAQADYPELIVLNGNCNAFTGAGDPYLPFLEMLEMLSGDVEIRWAGGAITREQARRIWQLLPEVIDTLVEDGPELIDRLVSGAALFARARSGAPSSLSRLDALLKRKAAGGGQQIDLFEQYSKVLQRLARGHPLLLIVDDLQWADTGSISLLFHLGRRLPGHRVLLVGAYRPEEIASGRDGSRHPLEPVLNELQREYGDNQVDLSKAAGRQWIDRLLDTEPNHLGQAFRETLFHHTNGHALFTVELLHGLQERGDLVKDEEDCWVEGPVFDWETLPPRVEAVIAQSINRLPDMDQTILSIASVEGEIFTAQAVARILSIDSQEIILRLSRLLGQQHRLVTSIGVQSVGGERISHYRFRHFLFQKYLYNRLDEVQRAHFHEVMGSTLEVLYGDQSPGFALDLAHHFELAGMTAQAVRYLLLAGNQAVRLYANIEAIYHYQRAIDLLQDLPLSSHRALQELRLRTALGVPLIATHGFSDTTVEQNNQRAVELTRQVETTSELFQVLSGLKAYFDLRLALPAALALAEDMLKLAEQLHDPQLQTFALHGMSTTLMYKGQLNAFIQYRRRASALYDRETGRTIFFQLGIDPEVAGLAHACWAYWILGYPEQARQHSQAALAWAEELGIPVMIAWAKYFAAQMHCYMREVAQARQLAGESAALSREIGAELWLAGANMVTGWALAGEGHFAEAVPQLEQASTTLRMSNAEFPYVQTAPLLLDSYARAGRTADGLVLIDEILKKDTSAAGRIVEADLYRSKGDLLVADGSRDAEAEDCFQQSIESARRIEGKSWELRAALRLCRLWRRQGKARDAYHLLSPIFSWFTEGFETPDLQEARKLLNELAKS